MIALAITAVVIGSVSLLVLLAAVETVGEALVTIAIIAACTLGAIFAFRADIANQERAKRENPVPLTSNEYLTLAVGAQQKLFAAQGRYSINATDLRAIEPRLGALLLEGDREQSFELGTDPRVLTIRDETDDGEYEIVLRTGRALAFDCDSSDDGCVDGRWRPDDELRAALALPEVLDTPSSESTALPEMPRQADY